MQVEPQENRSDDRPRLWTTAALLVSAPFVIALCLTLWRTPVPIGEAVALFEDAEEQPIARFLTPEQAYYRPVYHLILSALWHSGESLPATLAWIKLLTIGPVLLMVVLLIRHLRPRTMIEAAAAGLATAVLVGSPGFQDNLEVPLSYTIVGMAMALVVWIVLNRDLRRWHTPLIVLCTLVAIGFKEQGLVIVPLVIVAWWTRAPGASRSLAVTIATIGVTYVALRLFGRTVWLPFEQDVGLGFTLLDKTVAATRFGAFPYWMYAYSGASTVANVLFAEPTNGIFTTAQAVIEGTITPSTIVRVGSSLALTGVIAWWGIRSLTSAAHGEWSLQSRLVVAMVVVLLASGVLSFNYSRSRLGGMAVVFYALATFFAVRATAVRMLTASRAHFVVACVGLTLLVGAWHTRAIMTLESARDRSWRNQREWFVRLPVRRAEYAHRTGYVRILDSMVDQGVDPAAPRATRFPDWVFLVIGEP